MADHVWLSNDTVRLRVEPMPCGCEFAFDADQKPGTTITGALVQMCVVHLRHMAAKHGMKVVPDAS